MYFCSFPCVMPTIADISVNLFAKYNTANIYNKLGILILLLNIAIPERSYAIL